MELIRYIHLNPLRAKLVQDLKELDKYPWTGHSAILGKRKNPLIPDQPSHPNKPNKTQKSLAEKTIEDVLLRFGDKLAEARRRYRQFVEKGVDQGSRPELQGGGLVRSAGGKKAALLGRKKEDRELSDERILGSGDFVAEVLEEANELEERRIKNKISLDELVNRVSKDIGIEFKELISFKRDRKVSYGRAIISYLGAIELGYTGVKIAEALRLSEKSVSRCIEKGKQILDNDQRILDYLR